MGTAVDCSQGSAAEGLLQRGDGLCDVCWHVVRGLNAGTVEMQKPLWTEVRGPGPGGQGTGLCDGGSALPPHV
jgi:hypothetical protein